MRISFVSCGRGVGLAFLWTVACVEIGYANEAIQWQVVNRFPLFRDAVKFTSAQNKRREYLGAASLRNPAETIPDTLWDPFEQQYKPDLITSPIIINMSVKGAPSDATCNWTIDDLPLNEGSCERVTHSLAYDKTSAHVIVAIRRFGRIISLYRTTIIPRSVLIVSLGDSYASGEGVPDVDIRDGLESGLHDASGHALVRPARWWDQRCHRSLNSGPAQAAMDLAERNLQLQVVFVSFACSGAQITDGILGPYSGVETYAQVVAQLRKYTSNVPVSVPDLQAVCGRTAEQEGKALVQCDAVFNRPNKKEIDSCDALCIGAVTGLQFNDEHYAGRLPSQLNALLQLICADKNHYDVFALGIRNCRQLHRPIDALLLSVGGNDIGFGQLIKYLVLHGNAFDLDGFRLWQQQEGRRLSERYVGLAAALNQHIADPQKDVRSLRVFLTQYPDPTSTFKADDRCGVRERITTFQERSFSSWFADVFFFGISENEIGEIRARVIKPLAKAVVDAAETHKWNLVDKHVNAYRGHGYCNHWRHPNTYPWTNTHDDALFRQGALTGSFDNTGGFSSGAMHPNVLGYNCYAQALVQSLEAELLGRPGTEGPLCTAARD